MLVLLSPAKTLDLDSAIPAGLKTTQPRLLDRSQELVDVMATRSPDDIADLMGVSAEIAELNARRFADFTTPFTRRNARPAVLTFAGDVYQGLDAASLTTRDLTEAGKSVRILSGLYGVLRPLDLMQPYRLEMGRPVATGRGKDLYAFWGDTLTSLVEEDLAASPGAGIVVNLASAEYARAVDLTRFDVVSPRFEDRGPKGDWKVISFSAKRARGLMARWLVGNRVRTRKALTGFDAGGYRHVPGLGTPDAPVFRREG